MDVGESEMSMVIKSGEGKEGQSLKYHLSFISVIWIHAASRCEFVFVSVQILCASLSVCLRKV